MNTLEQLLLPLSILCLGVLVVYAKIKIEKMRLEFLASVFEIVDNERKNSDRKKRGGEIVDA